LSTDNQKDERAFKPALSQRPGSHVPLIWETLREQRAFDLEEYRSRLKNLKYVKPGKIFDLIEKEEPSSED